MKKRMTLWLGLILVCVVAMARPSENLLPMPQKMVLAGSTFTMDKVMLETPVLTSEWNEFVQQAGGKVVEKASKVVSVRLVPVVEGAKLNQEEAYRLVVSRKGIEVEATTEKGVYWALQTLRQLEQKGKRSCFETCEIVDWPAFKIRGFMHDIGRSYLSMDELKKEI